MRKNARRAGQSCLAALALDFLEALPNKDDFIDFDLDITGAICTVLQAQPGRGRFTRQSVGVSRYGEVKVVVEPHPGIHCYRFVWAADHDALPLPFMRGACLEGVKGALAMRLADGRQIAFVQVTVAGGSYHDVDTDHQSLAIAASMAVQDALRQARLVDL